MTISSADVVADRLVVGLSDGREISVPIEHYPALAAASTAALARFRLSPYGVHWAELDEDVGLTGLLSRTRQDDPVRPDHRSHLARDAAE